MTYAVYKLDKPVLIDARGDSLKIKFQIDSGATDPTATDNVWSTIDAGVGCLLDAQYVKNPVTGAASLNYHSEAMIGSQTDAGITNGIYSPAGHDDCFVIEGN
jgi:hypothetical protein